MNHYLGWNKSAILWREWLGLVCAFLWFFGSMYSFYEPFFTGIWTVLLFMLLLCMGLIGSAVLFGNYPKSMEHALPHVTLIGSVCTGLIPFLPVYAATALFWFSALMMTPLLCRRLYGVLRCARESIRIRTYISAVSATIALQMAWALLPLSFAVKFPVLSVFALLGLWRVEARLPAYDRAPLPQPAAARTPAQLARISIVILLLELLGQFNSLIHTFVVTESMESGDLFSLLSWLIAPISFLFFAYFSDKNRERQGLLIGVALILTGCFAALVPNNGVLMAPLLLTGEFGGTVTEFCFLTMPLLFFPFSKRPILVAVSGLVVHTLLASAADWTQELWLPQVLLSNKIDRPLIIFGSVCAVLLTPLAFSVWKRQADASLMGALLGLKKEAEDAAPPPAETAEVIPSRVETYDWMHALDLLEDEHRIAKLLCDGLTRTEIANETGLSAAKVAVHLRNIRTKLDTRPPVGHSAQVQEAARRYSLTVRETEVFGEIILGRSNTEISANLYIEPATVKTHVNRIMKKTGMASRAELIAAARKEGEATFPVG